MKRRIPIEIINAIKNKRRDGKEVFEKIREIRKQREGVCLNEIQRGIM